MRSAREVADGDVQAGVDRGSGLARDPGSPRRPSSGGSWGCFVRLPPRWSDGVGALAQRREVPHDPPAGGEGRGGRSADGAGGGQAPPRPRAHLHASVLPAPDSPETIMLWLRREGFASSSIVR